MPERFLEVAVDPAWPAGRQSYLADVLDSPNASALSVVPFCSIESMGQPYRITVELTYPQVLACNQGRWMSHNAICTQGDNRMQGRA